MNRSNVSMKNKEAKTRIETMRLKLVLQSFQDALFVEKS